MPEGEPEVPKPTHAWHAMTREDAIKTMGLDPETHAKTGLTSEQAQARLEKYGRNQMSEKKKETLLQKIWNQVANVLVGILVFVAVVSAIRAATDDPVTNSIQVGIIVGVIA